MRQRHTYIYIYIPHIYTDIYHFSSTSQEAAACVEAVALHVGKSLLHEPLLHVQAHLRGWEKYGGGDRLELRSPPERTHSI